MSATPSATIRPLLAPRLLVPWAALVIVAMGLTIGLGADAADHPTPFAIAHAYRLLVGMELFLLLALAPLRLGAARAGLLDLLLLLALAAPAAAAAAWAADCRWPQAAASQMYLAAAAVFVAGYLHADADGRTLAWYWLILGGGGVGGPLVGFVVEDLLRVPVRWLYGLSPFWIADQLSRPWDLGGWASWPKALTAAAALLLLGALCHAVSWRRSRLTSSARRIY